MATEAHEIRQILTSGGYVEVGDEFRSYEVREFINIGQERVTVRGSDFRTYELRQFASLGAKLILGKPLYSFEIKEVISASKKPSNVSVRAEDFYNFELREFARLGAIIIH